MDLVIFGLNHRTAPLEVREQWAFSQEEARQALVGAQDLVSSSENLILSTCHRTEIYSLVPPSLGPQKEVPQKEGLDPASPPDRGASEGTSNSPLYPPEGKSLGGAAKNLEDLLEFYHRLKNSRRERNHSYFYTFRRQEAVHHLFRLAAGLDSMILGEGEVLRQLREAYQVAREAGSVGKVFGKLFPAALRAGRRTRAETEISRGCITYGQAAVQLAREALGSLDQKRVLLLGSGKVSRLCGEALRELGVNEVAVMSRTLEKARKLAERIGGEAFPLGDLPRILEVTDLVISSTGSARPLVSTGMLEAAARKRRGRPLSIFDLAVPRDFDPACGEIPGVSLHNIDHLNQVIGANPDGRLSEVRRAESIIQEELRVFFAQMNWTHLDPVIRHLVERFETIRAAEVERYIASIPPEHHEKVKALTSALVKKMLHFPIEKLKSLRDGAGLTPDQITFLRRLFLNEPRG